MKASKFKKLLAVCETTTARFRGDNKIGKEQQARVDAVRAVLSSPDGRVMCENGHRLAVRLLSAATGQEWLVNAVTGGLLPVASPFTVVAIKQNRSGHKYRGKFYIVINDGRLLARNGLRGRRITSADDVAVASAKQVHACLETLTAKQLASIEDSNLFASVLGE